MSWSNNQSNTFHERRNKLSTWVKKIIQPNKEHKSSSVSAPAPTNGTLAVTSVSTAESSPAGTAAADRSSATLRAHGTHKTQRSKTRQVPEEEVRHPVPPCTLRQYIVQKPALLGTFEALGSKGSQSTTFTNTYPSSITSKRNSHTISNHSQPQGSYSQNKVEFEHANDNASTVPLVSVCSSSMKSTTFSDVHSAQSTRATVFSNKTFDTNSSTVGIPPASIVDRGRQAMEAPSVLSVGSSHTTAQPPPVRNASLRANSINNSMSHASISTIMDY
ncbi:HBR209Cp [Eremothecium sinecaudum]|uniref:HBR209Cp n=1 Tax=Eremothecium sinecaudum TaxID=45286 RepID=A0A120K183_9SACH|nr:HBR209Cp [Eremothecium sinecaudum]AMD19110.1 HBR209Cp [Eremothecium sinecaudum]